MAKAKKAKTRSAAQRSAAAKLSWANRKKAAKNAGKTATGQTKVATVHDKANEEPRYTATEWRNLQQNYNEEHAQRLKDSVDGAANGGAMALTGSAKPTPYLIALLTQRAENNTVTSAHIMRLDSILQRLTGCNAMEPAKQPELDPKSGLLINLGKQNEYQQYLNELLASVGNSLEGNI